jgi:hypothetical protein
MPIAGLVEAEDPVAKRCETKLIELEPCGARRCEPGGVSHEVQEVGITSCPVRTMPRMRAAAWIREISDPEGIAARKGRRDLLGRTLDGADERRGPVSRALARP